MKTTSLSVIVPVYNEQYLVRASLERLLDLAESPHLNRVRVIVVDDGSTDETAACLKDFQQSLDSNAGGGKFQWQFLRHPTNAGKGAAIQTALEHADTDLTVIHDADLEYHPADLLKMIPLFLEEQADAVYGSRFLVSEHKRVLFFRHTLGNRFLTLLCDLLSDLNITDVETCYKMVRTQLLRSIPLESPDFRIEIELTLKLAKRRARIFEVPIRYSGRTYAEGKKINWKDGVLALIAILKTSLSDRIYVDDPSGGEILERLNRAPRFNRWMADRIASYVGQHVLEVGAGIGNITQCMIPRKSYWATDVNPVYLQNLYRLSDGKPYFRASFTDVTDHESFPDAQSFDTVICLNVIEHLDDDVGALRNIGRKLRARGRAIVLVPQGPKLYGTLDRILGHCRRYTKEQLCDTASSAGFRVEEVIPFNRVGVIGWWVNGRLLRRTRFSLFQIKVLNLLIPLIKRLDPVLPLPPLSLIAILEKEPTASEVAPDRMLSVSRTALVS